MGDHKSIDRLLFVLLILAGSNLSAQKQKAHWPQWRGPDRSNYSKETGLLKSWPESGPPLLWTVKGIGGGIASVSVAEGSLYTVGYLGGGEFVVAVEAATGKQKWMTQIGPDIFEKGSMRWLSQRTPTIDGERLYSITTDGELVCLATKNGKELWRKSYTRDFEAMKPLYGFCDYPLIDGDKLICVPGGIKATIAALDKKTGRVVWTLRMPRKTLVLLCAKSTDFGIER